jgi:hypothetical protein
MSNLISRRWENKNLIFHLYFVAVHVCSWTVRDTVCAVIKGPGVPEISENFWNFMSHVQSENLYLSDINKIVSQLTSNTLVCLSVTISGTVPYTNQPTNQPLSVDQDTASWLASIGCIVVTVALNGGTDW